MQQVSRPSPRPQTRFVLPPERKFVQLPMLDNFEQTELCTATSFGKLRVLQFNMLADGLSGLRQDLGAFSRVTADDMNWDKRGKLLLHEILQYDPDTTIMIAFCPSWMPVDTTACSPQNLPVHA